MNLGGIQIACSLLTIQFEPMDLFPTVSLKCKCLLRCQLEREIKDMPRERCLLRHFSVWRPRYYCLLILQEKQNTRETSTAWAESDISSYRAHLNMNRWKYLSFLSVVFLFLLYICSPLAGCQRITVRGFVFYQGVSLNFSVIHATITSFPFRGLAHWFMNKKPLEVQQNHSLKLLNESGKNRSITNWWFLWQIDGKCMGWPTFSHCCFFFYCRISVCSSASYFAR